MTRALYGPQGFYRAGDPPVPAAHFRTSAQSGVPFATAVLRLLTRVDRLLGHPDPLDLVDVGAGGGELLAAVHELTGPRPDGDRPGRDRGRPAPGDRRPLAGRLRLIGVDHADRPAGLATDIGWQATFPTGVVGLLVATEWLDNVPLDLAVRVDGAVRYGLVDPVTGAERPGDPLTDADAAWLARWWPALPDDGRADLGRARDEAWAEAVRTLRRGVAVAVDYGHRYAERPTASTLTGYRSGRTVAPIPDGSCDITAHVAIDAVAAAGTVAAGGAGHLLRRQRDVLRTLGVSGARPPLTLAGSDPRGYLAALSAAGTAAELTDPYGLGAHWWLLQPVGLTAEDGSLPADVDGPPPATDAAAALLADEGGDDMAR
ncbi:SAM-dependent methyltransferase [Solwaraspora sp. WMMD791]|uniref:SAM-dependent methyltransferase n=1 Tax=Solwaraspora sp. WMMD791 TaxID=3016086 RepID=UPI00249A1B0E|nr:SAM-dependent methyltransferase [Solwaraspora sp. WMMD791]WFE30691.1 SAM-dependent methyltransferase [Solwaraspora sp. WMMD791]